MSITIGKPIDGCMYPFKPPINYDKKIPINDMPEDLVWSNGITEYVTHVTETEDKFIFDHVSRYVNEELFTPEYQTVIPKRLLERALICFKEEHKDEWNVLMGIKEDK